MRWPDELTESPDLQGAYPRLSDVQMRTLAAHGERRPAHRDDVLFAEGHPCAAFFVVLSGKVATVKGYGVDDQVIRAHGAGRFLGELDVLTGQVSSRDVRLHRCGAVHPVAGQRGRARLPGIHPDRAGRRSFRQEGRAGLHRSAVPLETSRAGVFAAGDVRNGSIKRVASAVGEGAMAVRLVHEHLQLRG
ncbi:cyclic nucleotide-binding domain-containing protein [Microbispora sp. H10836]|uniref:cyclic nucleotide-binding domain-containing protein n=1 Tax=Microbispora sp. H10836 TaxID=2729106 RepID=UPI00147334D5|nr:cyclic nucleotide-binding domain-containing protein [Microbispora sp. H10836]